MALKKGIFQNYVNTKDQERKIREIKSQKSKYKHHRVFDESVLLRQKNEDPDQAASTKEVITNSNNTKIEKDKKQEYRSVNQELMKSHHSIAIKYSDVATIHRLILSLTGIQQKLFFGLLKMAIDTNQYTINEISYNLLQQLTGTTYDNTKLAISRLVQKNLLVRHKGKTAKNGYYCLGFDIKTYDLSVSIARRMEIFGDVVNKKIEALGIY